MPTATGTQRSTWTTSEAGIPATAVDTSGVRAQQLLHEVQGPI